MKKDFTRVNEMLYAAATENPAAGAQETKAAEVIDGGNEDDGTDIYKAIDAKLRLSEEDAKLAGEAIAKRNKDRRVDEMKTLLNRSAYLRDKTLLDLRKSRGEAKVQKKFMAAIGSLDDATKAGKHDEFSYNKEVDLAWEDRAKGFKAINKTHVEYTDKLRKNYSDCWSVQWEWERRS